MGEIRAGIIGFLRRELIGPDPRPEFQQYNDGDEILRPQDPPRLRYSAGILFPGGVQVSNQEIASIEEVEPAESGPPEGDEPESTISENESSDIDDSTEHEINRANEFLPSALGLTALIQLPKELKVTVSAARYEKKIVDGIGKKNSNDEWQAHYFRKKVENVIPVDCKQFQEKKPKIGFPKKFIDTGNPDLKLELQVFSRPFNHAINPERDRIVTFTLINRTVKAGTHPKDSECLYQCELKIEDSEHGACFIEYPERTNMDDSEEELSLQMLYRRKKTFAVGHGCSAVWPETEDIKVAWIKTDAMPVSEIKPIIPREIENLELSLREFSQRESPLTIEKSMQLAEKYKEWIDKQFDIVKSPEFPTEYEKIAYRHLELCLECYKRIIKGIKIISNDQEARQAFEWMNEAMLMQQLHYDIATNKRRCWITKGNSLSLETAYHPPDYDNPVNGKGAWRPFQLAFILMNISSISDEKSRERAVVDLIWFPTGGGKTEAYLGLAAFTIFLRLLRDPNNIGTTVLMRYTLRLLTTQQFQRAASLICACEILRRRNEDRLGKKRITIGLWVGQGVTPNKNADAKKALQTLLTQGSPNKFVVITCPWCGAEMGPVNLGRSYRAQGYRLQGGKVVLRCEDSNCDFCGSSGLPLLVVDETIYDERPTLLVGTVDKFAMLPWVPEIRKLFGIDVSESISPPDLIIQDELHLISGALGSMVGMYEGTIDALCERKSNQSLIVAKIVASTATICQAAQQVHSLYGREVFLFPPQGLQVGESFFAEEANVDHQGKKLPGRMYVGVFGSALTSHITAQIRVISTLLQAVKCIPEAGSSLVDSYWTLMVYFNSLRELGHAATLIRADIREYLNALWDRLAIRKPENGNKQQDLRRFINRDLELTSRIQSSDITNVLQQLFNSYPEVDERKPVDICLATNMIQVGLDIPRLGLMTVIGQPKTTSEYIQATSRVGRSVSGPGIIVTIYNPAKPRDRSHFEHFMSYHQNIYRWVEPTSVTPFAVPVRERTLHAQLITLARYWGGDELRKTPNPAPDEELYIRIKDILINRIRKIDPNEAELTQLQLSSLIARWRALLPAIYGHFGQSPNDPPLMYPSGTEPLMIWGSRSIPTPSSMRNVDSECQAEIISQFPQN